MHTNSETQRLFDGISENTLTNFYMPYGVAPNFVINGRTYVSCPWSLKKVLWWQLLPAVRNSGVKEVVSMRKW